MSPNSCWFEEQNPCYEAVQFVLPEKLQPEKRSALAQGAKYSPARCIGWRANREQLEKVLHEFVDSDLPGKEHLVRYLIYQYRQNRRPNTLKSNSSNLKQFLGFLKTEKKSTVEEIDKKSVEAFVEYEQDRGMKPATVRTRLESVRAFLRFLIEEELICQDVLSKRVRVRVPESLPRAIDPEDVKELLSVIDNVRNRAMVLILLRTGMRIGEALNIRVQDIELKSRRIFIHEAKKTGSGRVVYFSNDAKEAIEAWLKEKDPREEVLFYGKSYEQLTYAAARALFQRYLKKAGLLGKGYTIHCLRHTFASELLNAGMRLDCLQPLLGHTSLEVTRRYARLTDKTREEEYFRAMAVVEKGGIDGHYQFDYRF